MKPPRRLQVCPKCLGTRIDLYLGGSAGKLYRCLDCNYVGPIVIETTYEKYLSLAKDIECEKGAGDQSKERGQ